jgi:hypothetical protein
MSLEEAAQLVGGLGARARVLGDQAVLEDRSKDLGERVDAAEGLEERSDALADRFLPVPDL